MSKKGLNNIIKVVILVMILIGLVILFWPSSGVELHINSAVAKDNKPAIVLHVETALARTKRLVEHKGKLAFTINKSIVDNPVPGMRFENALSFGDAVTLDASIKLKGKSYEFKADFKPNVIVEQIYDIAGAERYYIVVHNYKKEKPYGAQILARVYPIDTAPQEIPYRTYGTEDEIADQLGHYFLKAFTGSREIVVRL